MPVEHIEIIDDLKEADETTLSTLNNRNAQIWHPLLALAKQGGDEWFNRGVAAVGNFRSP